LPPNYLIIFLGLFRGTDCSSSLLPLQEAWQNRLNIPTTIATGGTITARTIFAIADGVVNFFSLYL